VRNSYLTMVTMCCTMDIVNSCSNRERPWMDVWLCRGGARRPAARLPSSTCRLSCIRSALVPPSFFSRNECQPAARRTPPPPSLSYLRSLSHLCSSAFTRARQGICGSTNRRSPIIMSRSSFVLHKFTHSQMVHKTSPNLALLTVISGSAACFYGNFEPIHVNFRIPVRISGLAHVPRERPIRFRFVFFSAKPIPPNRLLPSPSCFLLSPAAAAPADSSTRIR
jgi:hypothetical protein